MGAVPAEFIDKIASYTAHFSTINVAAIGLAAATILIISLWPYVSHRVPGPLVALLVTTTAAHYLGLDVETIGSRFGTLSASLPRIALPDISITQAAQLVGPAFTIALLGGIESLLSAVVADGMIGGRHRPNMELVAQGIANIASPLFGGIPATGAIARTATNIKNGGRTPVAGIFHSLTVLLVTLFFGRWASLIPMASLAGILMVVAYHMSEWRVFRMELTSPKSDVAVLLVAFFLTVFVDLTVAIEIGMVVAVFLFMRRMADLTQVAPVTDAEIDREEAEATEETRLARIPRGVEVFQIEGPIFFGAVETFKDTLARVSGKPKVLILRMRYVPSIDATGIHTLTDVVRRSRGDGTLVLLSGVQPQPLAALRNSALMDEIGEEHLFASFQDALARAREELELRRLFRRTGEVTAAR